ncbi:hypothetical protein T492DRAFT_312345 [Pavlovales sp. CCMP2436]|nr:hypothetical protein T492DRAFT_312345 [Pavlovales sp. CCMP2436]
MTSRRDRHAPDRLSATGSELLVGENADLFLQQGRQLTSAGAGPSEDASKRRTSDRPPSAQRAAFAVGADSPPAARERTPAGGSRQRKEEAMTTDDLVEFEPGGLALQGASKQAWWSCRKCVGAPGARCEAQEGQPCKSRDTGDLAIGWQLDVYWPPDKRWFHAEVIAHDLVRGAHEILYPVGSEGGPETEVNLCLGSNRVHVISTTPVPLPWRFDCVCGVHFDQTAGFNVDGNSCVQCTTCERWMHGTCVSSNGVVQTHAFAPEAAKIDAVRLKTGPTPRQQLCWLASERHFCCPRCICPGDLLALKDGVSAAPEQRVENDSDLEESEMLERNDGCPIRVGELYPKRSSCGCVADRCSFSQCGKWGRSTGAPAVACTQCHSRMHVQCSLKSLRLFLQRCSSAAAAGVKDDPTRLFLCDACSDSPASGLEESPSSDEGEGEVVLDDEEESVGVAARKDAPPSSLSSRVTEVRPCGECYQCTHPEFFVLCARRSDARYQFYSVMIPYTELQVGASSTLGAQLVESLVAPYGGGAAGGALGGVKSSAGDARSKFPNSLVPSLAVGEMLRGVVHRVVRHNDAPPKAGASRADVHVFVHFDHGAIVALDEPTFLRFTREPRGALIYRSPVPRQLSQLNVVDRDGPLSASLRVLKELIRRSDCFHRVEVREIKKMKGQHMTTMQGVFARTPPNRRSKVAIKLGRFVGVYGGTVLLREQTLSAAQTNQQYLFDLNDQIAIDGSLGGNVTRYINHANTLQDANLDPFKLEIDGEIIIAFIARRPIVDGEELLYRYGDFSFLGAEWNDNSDDDDDEPNAPHMAEPALVPASTALAARVEPAVLTAVAAPAAAVRFGVTRDPIAALLPFRACVQLEDTCRWIGRFESLAEASRAYDSYVTKHKLRLPTNNMLESAVQARVVSGEGEGEVGEVHPSDYGYFTVHTTSGATLVKNGSEIVLVQKKEVANGAGAAAKKRAREEQERGGAELGDAALRAELQAVSGELASVKAQLDRSDRALSYTCSSLTGLAEDQSQASLEQYAFLRDELSWYDEVAALGPSDPELNRLVASRRAECQQAIDDARESLCAQNARFAGIRSTLDESLAVRREVAAVREPAVASPALERVKGPVYKPGLKGPASPAARAAPSKAGLGGKARVRHVDRSRGGQLTLTQREFPDRSVLVGRRVRVTVGDRLGETGTISGLNGRYLRVIFEDSREEINKILETLLLLDTAKGRGK